MSFDTIKGILDNVSTDLKKMDDLSAERNEDLLGIMDDLAANIMATQSVVSALAQSNDLKMDGVENWLKENTNQEGEGSDKALALAKYLVTGN
ncbi:MAG: hypothetical protein GY804_12960 [Alphaproteobacteria bacterium]|nr:hypothetical protein [Alphaproteobacteria bacterium]